jgi:hypothetical protein
MGCGCKSDNNSEESLKSNENQSIGKSIGFYIGRSFIFIFSLLLLPIIVGAVVYVLFKHIVLSRDTDFQKMFVLLGKKLMSKEESVDDSEDEDEIVDPNDYELMDIVNIKDLNKNSN